jgi:hypothetical protein
MVLNGRDESKINKMLKNENTLFMINPFRKLFYYMPGGVSKMTQS